MGKLKMAFHIIVHAFRVFTAYAVIRFSPEDIKLHMSVKELGFDVLQPLEIGDCFHALRGCATFDAICTIVGAYVLFMIINEVWRIIGRVLKRI